MTTYLFMFLFLLAGRGPNPDPGTPRGPGWNPPGPPHGRPPYTAPPCDYPRQPESPLARSAD